MLNVAMRNPPAPRTICVIAIACLVWHAGAQATQPHGSLSLHLVQGNPSSPRNDRHPHLAPAAAWLKPLGNYIPASSPGPDRFVLLQKNRMFTPHLLVVPVGSIVLFPNADPFFHNVFSLFDGKRFDLGLYEAGSTKEVTFSREGLSYIFCNIHPEMSAVVISLSTPFYTIAKPNGVIELRDIPPGDYELHIWVEGEMPPALDKLTRRVHVGSSELNLGEVMLPAPPDPLGKHENKFGQPYDQSEKPVY